jgi:hypothetical protein
MILSVDFDDGTRGRSRVARYRYFAGASLSLAAASMFLPASY